MGKRTPEHNAAIAAALRDRTPPTKVCPSCREEFDREVFGRRSNGHWESYCPPCKKLKTAATSRRYYHAHPERRGIDAVQNRALQLKRHYGLTVEDYDSMLEAQDGVCAICHEPPPVEGKKRYLSVDHDHRDERVRGLLCDRCNRGLGLLRDDQAVVEAALNYLRR